MNCLSEALNQIDTRVTKPKDTVDTAAQFFSKLEQMGYNLDELKPFIECDKCMLGLSGAGAGKTTALVLKIIYEYITGRLYETVTVNGVTYTRPKKILVATFLKSGAEDLKRVLTEFCNKLGITGMPYDCMTFGTLHSEFYNAIKTMTGITPKITTGGMGIVRSAMQEFGVRRKDSLSPSITNDEVMDISGLITYYINMLDDKKYDHPLMNEYNINDTILDAVVNRYRTMLSVLDETDFDLMQELLYTSVQNNEGIKEFLRKRYNVIFIDEFQDTSQLQYALLKEYISGCERVIVIGDDDQCIYSWRASDINIICHQFREDFNPEICQLSVNYRCKADILNAVIPSICKNENRYEKQLKAANPGGIVEVYEDLTGTDLLEHIENDLKEYSNVGVISRTNNDLIVPAIYLELRGGIEYQVSGGVSLDSKLTKTIFSSIELVTKRYTENFPSILKSLFKPFVAKEINKLCGVLKANVKYNLFNIPMNDLYASVPNMVNFIQTLREIDERGGKIAVFQAILWYYQKTIFVKDTPYQINGRNIASLLYGLFDNDGLLHGKDIYTVERLLMDELPKRIGLRTRPSKTARVKLTTAHDAKGKEWDCVYIYNFNNKVFPSVMIHGSKAEFEEERRIAYISWTRAKEKLVVCTSKENPSPFLRECDLGNAIMNKPLDVKRVVSKGKTPYDVVNDYCQKAIVEQNVSPELYDLLGVSNDIAATILEAIKIRFEEQNENGVELCVGDITDKLIDDAIKYEHFMRFGD